MTREHKKHLDQKRLFILTGVVVLVLGALVMRLFFIQVLWGKTLGRMALANRTVTEEIPSSRGVIYDRNLNPLVDNEPASSVYADPKEIKSPAHTAAILSPYLGVGVPDLVRDLSLRNNFVWLKFGLTYNKANSLKNLLTKSNIKGIYFLPGEKLFYPQGDLAAQVLGFTGEDDQGLSGLEYSYNKVLAGTPGWMKMQIDGEGRPLPGTITDYIPDKQGKSLVLTIDENIQYFVEQELDNITQKYHPAGATIIVMNPKTGGILALGNRPTYNPASWQSYPENVWDQNFATQDVFEPGSIFKIISTSAALEEGLATPESRYSFPGYITVQGKRIYDWNYAKDNNRTLSWAFADSYNPVFSQLGVDLNAAKFYPYIYGFGFGQRTGIDLPGESSGIIIPENQATPLNLATMAIGQSISVTPLQLITAACVVANGGYLMQPRLVKEILDGSGNAQKIGPKVVRQVISATTASQMMDMMRRVVETGTGQPAAIPGYTMAGKTGTAQVPGPGGYLPGKYVSSFLGVVPASNPDFVMLVVVDEPKGGQYYGGEVAAPCFKELAEKILYYLSVPKDAPVTQAAKTSPSAAGSETVPNLLGLPVNWAEQILSQAGLSPVVYGSGQIVAGQSPGPGSTLTQGTKVDLKLIRAGSQIVVPNLTGFTIKETGDILGALGLNLAPEGSGLAVKQNPAPGTGVAPGATVQVEFSPSPY